MCTHEVGKGYDDIVYIDGSNIQWMAITIAFMLPYGTLLDDLSKCERDKERAAWIFE